MTARFGVLTRVAYNIDATDDAGLEAGELDPRFCFVSAPGVPEPGPSEAGTVVAVEWNLDERPRFAMVTFWNPR